MQILLCVLSLLFGGLSLIAAISQMKKEKKPVSAIIMMIGALMLIAAVICNLCALWFDDIIAVFGCAVICAAAIFNGKKSGQFHIQHHIIRIVLSLILIVGFILL